jgi:hypothetical protein|eukprot:CAMPEP_0174280882 /NCGR_PEP_ID=MMETSP0809-20121228/1202_1 /TAXON_ID=73025 ORGANISM="Eutreptiella gymnastica-like, Strain CCMP1594" /NCGR_SAMPLE_ID=MMETSP0809 /ASSEMBLY_ACC=CAM_ASM_000658 /LENGTH=272 /DNA_ID=CAMNT_0015374065 /DNA_START=18 /DNA_END=836 /DNA_ORIENTATION=-
MGLCHLLFLVLVTLVKAAEKPKHPVFDVEHSLDQGSTWKKKGKVTVKVVAGMSEIRFQPAFATWTQNEVDTLVELSKTGGRYQIRAPRYLSEEDTVVDDHVMISIAPCVMFNNKFKEGFNFYVSTSGGVISSVVGIQNLAVQNKHFRPNYCHDAVASYSAFNPPVKHTAVFGLASPSRPPVIAEDTYGGARGFDHGGPGALKDQGGPNGERMRGKQEQKPEEKSFMQKYWLYILLGGVGFMMLNSPNMEEQMKKMEEERARQAGNQRNKKSQ